MMMRGTGPLPQVEPWRGYARRCRILGRDVSTINGPLWNIIYAGKDVWSDAQALERTMMMRVGGIALLMLGCRLMINQMRATGGEAVVSAYIDMLGFAIAVLVAWVVLSIAVKSIPRSWLWGRTDETWSPAFFQWFEMLALDEAKPVVTTIPEISEADLLRANLRASELRDGSAKDEERRLVVLEAASAMNRRDRVKLARFSATLPFLDLVIAGLLAAGFCGVPFVEWLLQSGMS